MAQAHAPRRWTIADLEALPYDEWRRYEIIDGELYVSTAPRREHQLACNGSAFVLTEWNSRTGLGEVLPGAGIVFTNHDGVVPDVLWISNERLAVLLDDAGHLRGAPELIVEVLSPGAANERRDREIKLGLYSAFGVEEYWLLDWRTQTVVIYRRASMETQTGDPQQAALLQVAATLGREDTLTSPLLPGFAVRVARLFGRS
ncbi:MAG TPA: Uma2 family endonuclease [Chloroflexota bacterium]|nr:Uma2 family endonuclease [Chloroflexota bacterium]